MNPPQESMRLVGHMLNQVTATGTHRHCSKYHFEEKFSSRKLDNLYSKDALLQQAIDTPVEDSLSPWREGVEHDSEFDVKEKLIEAVKQARLYPDVAILPVLSDENGFIAFSFPLEAAIARGAQVQHLIISKDVTPGQDIDNNLFSENYGKPIYYEIQGKTRNGKVTTKKIHHTRLVVVKGSRGKKTAAESFMYYFEKFHESYEEMVRATGESNVWTLGTDLQAIQDAYNAAIEVGVASTSTINDAKEKRLENFRGSMNSRGAYIYDKNAEEIDRNPVTNLKDIVSAVQESLAILCAAVDIVPSRFIGKQAGSLNSSSMPDITNMVMIACNFRSQFAEPSLKKLDGIINLVGGREAVSEYQWNPIKAEELAMRQNEPVATA